MLKQNKLLIKIEQLTELVVALQKQSIAQKRKKYYSYKEASEILCIKVEGLKTRIKRGQMVRTTNNNRPLISHEEIERFLNNQNPKF
jgi:hypothetical protein